MNTACKDGLTPEKESDLGALRAQLDRIDAELQTLFERRMALCGQIGDYKKEHALAVRDAAREEELLRAVAARSAAGMADYDAAFFRSLLALSRRLQTERAGLSEDG